MFILFILSHGTLNGKVFTDYPLVTGADKRKIGPNETESYLVSEIWDEIKNMHLLDECLFLLMLGVSCGYSCCIIDIKFCIHINNIANNLKACRGEYGEVLYEVDGPDENSPVSTSPVDENACRLLNEPNMKNFIIFYATVESE